MFRLPMGSRETRAGDSLARRLRLMVTLAVAALAVAASAASAESSAPPVAVLEDCRERAVLLAGVEERVRRRVPAPLKLVRDPLGRPLLIVVGARCTRYTVSGTTKPTKYAFFMAVIESPDGGGCSSRWPAVGAVKPDLIPLCNFYPLFAVYDHRVGVSTYRTLLPEFPVFYVRDLTYEAAGFDPTRLGEPLRFQAGPPTPSPFELDAVIRDGPVGGPMTFSFWFPRPSGLVGGRFEVDDWAAGQMDVRLRAAPGSEIAHLLGATTPRPIAGVATHFRRAEARGVVLDGGGGVGAVPRLGVSLSGLRLSHNRFRPADRGRAVEPTGRRLGRRVGTRVRYRLSGDAEVTFGVQRVRRRKGRIVGGRCVTRTRRNVRRRKCTRYRTLRGKFTHVGHEGVNRLRWTGRLRGRGLRRGRYRLIARARSGSGARSQQAHARFRIVRR